MSSLCIIDVLDFFRFEYEVWMVNIAIESAMDQYVEIVSLVAFWIYFFVFWVKNETTQME